MNVKRYRAATMRGALEQIKSELGDEALVLGSREIRSKGFLGIGGKDFVEVRVSTETSNGTKLPQKVSKQTPERNSGFTSLSLRDASPATPALSTGREQNLEAISSALASRAGSSDLKPAPRGQTTPSRTKPEPGTARKYEPAERPRVSVPQTPIPTELADISVITTAPARESLATELEHLRAEVREVKFTLTRGSLNNGHNLSAEYLLQDAGDADSGIYDTPYYEAYLHLASLGLPPNMCRAAVAAAIASGNKSEDTQTIAHNGLVRALPSFVSFDEPVAADQAGGHSVIALVGPTGVGKTTTIAKLAAKAALREHRRVELITIDTYRIAAVDQLRTYAEIIGAGFHALRSVLELDALVQRLSGDATLLIDTIGRSARDLVDQLDLADYLKSNARIDKYLVIQATTNPTDAQLAIDKFALFGTNKLVITKLDETSIPGAAISIAAASRLPLVQLCGGQRVPEDIEKATPLSLAAHTLQSFVSAKTA